MVAVPFSEREDELEMRLMALGTRFSDRTRYELECEVAEEVGAVGER